MDTLVHVLSGLQVGGKERIALDLATRGRSEGRDHRLLLFDTPFRGDDVDFPPGDVPVDFERRGPGLDLRFAWRLARRLRRLGAEVVHAHNDTALFYCALATRLMRAPRPVCVGTFHTRPGHDTRAARALTRWASRRVDAVTSVSRELAETLRSAGWVHDCDVLPNGVDLARFTPDGGTGRWRRELEVPDGALVVAHVGRFDPIKRHVDLLEATAALRSRTTRPFVLVLVGDGPTRPDVRRLAADRDDVRLVTCVHDVPGFLRDVDVFALCSEHECAPRVLLEAMACGRAAVASDVGGVRDIVTGPDGVPCAELVPARDVERLAGALQRLVEDASRRDALGARARERVQSFGADEEWRRYTALYRGDAGRPDAQEP